MANTEKEFRSELKELKDEIRKIKLNMVDKDMVLTLDENKILRESISEYKKGKTVDADDFFDGD